MTGRHKWSTAKSMDEAVFISAGSVSMCQVSVR